MGEYITKTVTKTGKYAGDYVIKLSPEDASLLDEKWYIQVSNPFLRYAVSGKKMSLHRMVMERVTGRKLRKDEIVDHYFDFDGLNCTRENLRIVTASQNASNRRKKTVWKRYRKHQKNW